MTLNVFGPSNPDWSRRSRLIAKSLQRIRPVVVALQEVPVDDDFAAARQLLGPGYTFHPFSRPAEDGVAGLLATSTPSRPLHEIDQRCTPRAYAFSWCATMFVETSTALGRVLVVHHKPSWQFGYELERERPGVGSRGAGRGGGR